MKGKSKYILPLILAGVTASAGVATTFEQQQIQVQADVTTPDTINDVAGATISMVGGFLKKVDGGNPVAADCFSLGDIVLMPSVTVNGKTGTDSTSPYDGFDVTYKIYRGDKKKPVAELKAGTDTLEFKPTFTGAYNVEVVATKNNNTTKAVTTTLTGLTIMVEKAEAVINLPVNSKYVIPARIPANNANGLTIPAPTVTLIDEDGEEKAATDLATNLKVKVVTPDGVITGSDLAFDDETDTYKLTSAQLAKAGTYQVRYEYYDGTTLLTKLETNFQVIKDMTAPTSLYLKLSGSVPATGNVNKEVQLPKVTVLESASSTDGVKAHITVKVTKLKSDGTVDGSPVEITDYENYTWTPAAEGNYIVSYQADLNSVYGNVTSEAYSPATIIKISDKANPTVMATYAYDVVEGEITAIDRDNSNKLVLPETDANADYVSAGYTLGDYTYEAALGAEDKVDELLTTRRVDVPSVVVRGADGKATFRLPAIYGTDNKTSYSKMKFTREIVGNEISRITVAADANEWSEIITLQKVGNYEVRYTAEDEAGNKVRATYTLVVKDPTDVEDAETTITMNIGVSSITDKETLKFNVPTAKDTYDGYVDVVTEYEVYAGGNTPVATVKLTDKDKNKDGKYEINIADVLAENTNATSIKVVATATRDAYTATTEKTREKEIKIINTSTDTSAATIKIGSKDVDASTWNEALYSANEEILFDLSKDNTTSEVASINAAGYALDSDGAVIKSSGDADLAAFNQGKSVLQLPEVTFEDADANLGITLTIQDKYGNTVTKETYEDIEKTAGTGVYNYTIKNASFKLSASGIYTVTYRAKDTAGNVSVKTFGIRVNDKTAPTIVIDDEDKYGVNVEVGEFFEVPVGRLIKDGAEVNGEVSWTVTYSDGAECEIYSTGFVPKTEGTFYITYTGIDELDNTQILKDNSLFYVNAEDSTDPVFNEDSSYILPPTIDWEPDATTNDMNIDIPRIEATDPIKNNAISVVYSVSAPDGSKVTVKDYEGDAAIGKEDVRYFVAESQGVYTITYTATDDVGNSVTKTMEVSVGDCEAPTITWKDGYEITDEVQLGSTWELDLSKLTISDNVSDSDFLNDNVTIKLVKPDGTTQVTNEGNEKSYKWTFDEAGEYTLTITVKDEAGMSNPYKYKINVPKEDVEDDTIDSVVGTILVVVSVVILAGVVIYFVVSSRKKTGAKKTSKK